MKIDATDISMGNAAVVVAAGAAAIRGGDPAIDLSAVQTCDSSAVAAVLAWQREAARAGHSLRLIGTPADLLSLASVYGVESLIAISE
jgi:phospholipid transport system transporter-binding protein